MNVKIKYNKKWGIVLILLCLLVIFLMVLIFLIKGSIIYLIFISPLIIIAILIGFFYLTEEYAIQIKEHQFSTGYGLSKISFDLRDVIQLIPDIKVFNELVIVLKDKPDPVIKLSRFSKIINLVSRTKINRNTVRIHSYILNYDFKQLEREIKEEVEKLNNSNLKHRF